MEVNNVKDTNHDENENISLRNTPEEKLVKHLPETNIDRIGSNSNKRSNIFLMVCIVGVSLGILLEIINAQNRNRTNEYAKRKYWVYSNDQDVEKRDGILKHVHNVLERLGYEKTTNKTDWDLLWSHSSPFSTLHQHMHRLKKHQRVNHFPGNGAIVNKVTLATTDSKYIPRAFSLPKNKADFLKYASANKNAMFMEKNNKHRGVYLKNVSEINLDNADVFVQEFMQNPFLVDGHKFDIGVYVVITSVEPLRVYWYKGDVLFRYCPKKYHPLDPKDLDKYVIGNDYLPTWEVPSLAQPYVALGYSMKDSFDLYAQSQGKDTVRMWNDVREAIVDIILKKEQEIVQYVTRYPYPENFFEMMRFDLIVDEDLRVYLLEANMSPNLSSAHYAGNQLLYEQVLYSLYGITGIANQVAESDQSTADMLAAQKNIAVWTKECSTTCKNLCYGHICNLCKPCLDEKLRKNLLRAHKEFMHRGDFARIFPPPMKQGSHDEEDLKNLKPVNQLQYLWYQGKCNTDVTWCN